MQFLWWRGYAWRRFERSNLSLSLRIINSTFANNEAAGGSGVYVEGSEDLHVDIIESSFHENTGNGGSALCVCCFSEEAITVLCSIDTRISKSTFSNNNHLGYDSSVISVSHAPFVKMNGIVVEFNDITTAIRVLSSTIEFTGSSRISNNTGISGVGLTLHDSQLVFKPNTDLIITNNYALTTGGGVQVLESIDNKENSDHCFYTLSYEIEKNISLAQTVNYEQPCMYIANERH